MQTDCLKNGPTYSHPHTCHLSPCSNTDKGPEELWGRSLRVGAPRPARAPSPPTHGERHISSGGLTPTATSGAQFWHKEIGGQHQSTIPGVYVLSLQVLKLRKVPQCVCEAAVVALPWGGFTLRVTAWVAWSPVQASPLACTMQRTRQFGLGGLGHGGGCVECPPLLQGPLPQSTKVRAGPGGRCPRNKFAAVWTLGLLSKTT